MLCMPDQGIKAGSTNWRSLVKAYPEKPAFQPGPGRSLLLNIKIKNHENNKFKINDHDLLSTGPAGVDFFHGNRSTKASTKRWGKTDNYSRSRCFRRWASWNKVIPILEKQGYQVITVQPPLTSLRDDVAAVDRAISEVKGKVVLVGHSWGGAVITQAGNNEKVKALVYVAAYAPSEGQSIDSISREAYAERKVPNVHGFTDPVVTDGYIRLKEETIVKYFAQDLPLQETKN
jgi:pimeloyl-ACP methyl ester carboxylesterase